MKFELEAIEREDGRLAVFHGDNFVGHLRPVPETPASLAPIFEALSAPPEVEGRSITRRPAKKRASVTRAKAPRAEKGKGGRKPVPWFCRECSNNTSGPVCGSCGNKRPPVGER